LNDKIVLKAKFGELCLALKPKIVDKKEVFKGRRFSVERRYVAIDGNVVERDIVLFPESVVVLPVFDEDRILLIKQYRPAIDDYIIEAPAGVVEPGEDVKYSAERELVEETGYRAEELVEIGVYYPVPGYSVEKMHLFIARGLEYVGSRPEPYEVIKPVYVSLENALDMVRSGLIVDLKTIAILLYYTMFIKGESGV